jgi:hypothetical protein
MTSKRPQFPGVRIAVFASIAAATRRPRPTLAERARAERRRLDAAPPSRRAPARPSRGVS